MVEEADVRGVSGEDAGRDVRLRGASQGSGPAPGGTFWFKTERERRRGRIKVAAEGCEDASLGYRGSSKAEGLGSNLGFSSFRVHLGLQAEPQHSRRQAGRNPEQDQARRRESGERPWGSSRWSAGPSRTGSQRALAPAGSRL